MLMEMLTSMAVTVLFSVVVASADTTYLKGGGTLEGEVHTLDLTGGAPGLNPGFRSLARLAGAFEPATLRARMCRNTQPGLAV